MGELGADQILDINSLPLVPDQQILRQQNRLHGPIRSLTPRRDKIKQEWFAWKIDRDRQLQGGCCCYGGCCDRNDLWHQQNHHHDRELSKHNHVSSQHDRPGSG